jgi:hypothetical protein
LIANGGAGGRGEDGGKGGTGGAGGYSGFDCSQGDSLFPIWCLTQRLAPGKKGATGISGSRPAPGKSGVGWAPSINVLGPKDASKLFRAGPVSFAASQKILHAANLSYINAGQTGTSQGTPQQIAQATKTKEGLYADALMLYDYLTKLIPETISDIHTQPPMDWIKIASAITLPNDFTYFFLKTDENARYDINKRALDCGHVSLGNFKGLKGLGPYITGV